MIYLPNFKDNDMDGLMIAFWFVLATLLRLLYCSPEELDGIKR